MQTFLPYGPDFARTAQVLDDSRLMKQRVEVLQILNAATGRSRGWTRHPAVLMWTGHEGALLRYEEAICVEVARRGFRDTCLLQCRELVATLADPGFEDPPWLRDERRRHIEITHGGNLHRKDPEHYAGFRAEHDVLQQYTCHPACRYYWPTHVRED